MATWLGVFGASEWQPLWRLPLASRIEDNMKWAIMLPMPGTEMKLEVCVCESAEKLAAVIVSLCNASKNPPPIIIIESRSE